VHKLVTTGNAFIDARLNYETWKIHMYDFTTLLGRWVIQHRANGQLLTRKE